MRWSRRTKARDRTETRDRANSEGMGGEEEREVEGEETNNRPGIQRYGGVESSKKNFGEICLSSRDLGQTLGGNDDRL